MKKTKQEIVEEREKLELELKELKELDVEKKELAKMKKEVLKYKNQGLLKAGDVGKKALISLGDVGWKVAGVLKQGAINMNDNYQAAEKEKKKNGKNKKTNENPFKF